MGQVIIRALIKMVPLGDVRRRLPSKINLIIQPLFYKDKRIIKI